MVHRSFANSIFGLALAPQTIATTVTVNGITISKPSKLGRMLKLILIGAITTAQTGAYVKVQGRIGTGSWNDIPDETDATGATAVQYDTTDLNAVSTSTDKIVGNTLVGSLPIDRLSYDDYRVVAHSGNTGAIYGVIFEICELYERFENGKVQQEHFYFKVTPYTDTLGEYSGSNAVPTPASPVVT